MEIIEPPVGIEAADGEPLYFATIIAGLESVVADEIAERIPAAELRAATRGKLFFAASAPPQQALDLMTIEHLLGYLGELTDLPAGREGLAVIEEWAAGLELDAALASFHLLHGEPARPSFRITAYRSGSHDYNSQEVSAAAGAGVIRSRGWGVDLTGYDYDIRVYVIGGTALAGLRLSPEPLHQRARVRHAAASLNATVAHAMCRLIAAGPGEIVVDPMCGAGTILVEQARLQPPHLLIGGDFFTQPLQAARENLVAADVDGALLQWDARRLPLRRGSVDAVICNLPWGRRIGSHLVNRHLYPGFVRELRRILRPGGKAALLTQERRLLLRLLEKSRRLTLLEERLLSLSGMQPAIYLIQREER
jgi:tRNA (guanine6-N2)-methyltransferase